MENTESVIKYSGVNISLTLNDKASLVNGDVGGVIPTATIFSEQEIYSADGTSKEDSQTRKRAEYDSCASGVHRTCS